MPFKCHYQRYLYNSEYYSKHADEIKLKNVGYVYCSICNKNISKINYLKHQRRKVHIQLWENSQKRNYIDKLLSQKFDCNISGLIASYVY